MYIIGVAGGSGSGKSTFADGIKKALGEDAFILKCDNYYFPHDDIPLCEREKLNYDSPEAIDFSLLMEHLNLLRAGQDVYCPIYDFSQHTRSRETELIKPSPVLIIDGILLYTNKQLRDMLDLKIYVDSDADERILRRTKRDILERGRTIDSVIEQYVTTVKPMHYLHVEPTKSYADIVINGGHSPVALDLVINKINNMI